MFRSIIFSRYAFSIWIVLTCVGPSVAADTSFCDVLLPSDTQRRAEGDLGESHCYRLDLSTSGLLHLDLSVINGWEGETSRARLAVTAHSAGQPVVVETVWRSASERLIMVPAGTYFLAVSAEDPSRPLPAYRVSSRFAVLDKSETDGELEVDPFPLVGSPQKSETDGELEVDPFPLQSLCKDSDDHGDTFVCATLVQRTAIGELGNGWGDDVDVFRFEVGHWQTLEITVQGTNFRGELFDGTGQRLDGGDGFRLVRTLGPGTYFVRVDGSGTYRLEMREVG